MPRHFGDYRRASDSRRRRLRAQCIYVSERITPFLFDMLAIYYHFALEFRDRGAR